MLFIHFIVWDYYYWQNLTKIKVIPPQKTLTSFFPDFLFLTLGLYRIIPDRIRHNKIQMTLIFCSLYCWNLVSVVSDLYTPFVLVLFVLWCNKCGVKSTNLYCLCPFVHKHIIQIVSACGLQPNTELVICSGLIMCYVFDCVATC